MKGHGPRTADGGDVADDEGWTINFVAVHLNFNEEAGVRKSGKHILSTYLVGKGLAQFELKSDDVVVQDCLQVLSVIFPEKRIPEPVWSHVTHWSQDPHIGMACTYIPVGKDSAACDVLAQDVEERVYFAGEATNRQFPQTITGAYLSGVREARRIIDSCS